MITLAEFVEGLDVPGFSFKREGDKEFLMISNNGRFEARLAKYWKDETKVEIKGILPYTGSVKDLDSPVAYCSLTNSNPCKYGVVRIRSFLADLFIATELAEVQKNLVDQSKTNLAAIRNRIASNPGFELYGSEELKANLVDLGARVKVRVNDERSVDIEIKHISSEAAYLLCGILSTWNSSKAKGKDESKTS